MTRRMAATAVVLAVALAAFCAMLALVSPRAALAGTPSTQTANAPATATQNAPATAAQTAAATGAPRSTGGTTAPPPPPLDVRAAALIEQGSGQQLYGQNSSAQLAIASTTKLMTALITLEHVPLSRVFADPNYYPSPEDSQIHLEPGERMSVHDLLIAMLLPSADDAAVDLAYNVGHRSLSRFEGMMNARARQLGLTHTHYSTPSGLDTPGNYSSASDLVDLARYLLQTQPFFKAVVRTTHAVLRTGNHVRDVVNLNDLVVHYSWINGVKTGHTLDAGYVLVASGTQGGMTLIDAVLGTSSEAARDSNALALLNWGFANFSMRTPVRTGRVLARPAIAGKQGAHVRLIAASSYTHVFPRSAKIRLRVTAPAQVTGPLPRNAQVGSVAVVDGGQVVTRIPLLLAAEVPQIRKPKSIDSVVVVSVTLSGLLVAAGAVIGLTMFWREWTRGTGAGRPRATKPR